VNCFLYQNEILRESGDYQQALDHLIEHEEKIVDKVLFLEIKSTFFMEIVFAFLLRHAIHLLYGIGRVFSVHTIDDIIEIRCCCR